MLNELWDAGKAPWAVWERGRGDRPRAGHRRDRHGRAARSSAASSTTARDVVALVLDPDPQLRAVPERHRRARRRSSPAGSRTSTTVERAIVGPRARHRVPPRRADDRRRGAARAAAHARDERARHLERAGGVPASARRSSAAVVVASSDKAYGTVDDAARTARTCRSAGASRTRSRRPRPTSIAQTYATAYGAAGRDRPLRQHLRRRATSTGRGSSRARSARCCAASSRCCAATARSCATTCTSTTSSTRTSRSPTASSAQRARARRGVQLLRRVAALRAGASTRRSARRRVPRAPSPLILGEAPGEIHDQWLSAEKARDRLGWTAAGRARRRASPAPSTGTAASSLAVTGARPAPTVRRRRARAPRSSRWSPATTRSRSRRRPFVPGETPVPVSGKVFDDARDAAPRRRRLDFWLTTGRFADEFEARFAAAHGCRARAARATRARRRTCSRSSALDVAAARRRGAAARRRGDHLRVRVPDDRQPDLPARPRAGVRRRRPGHATTSTPTALEEAVGPRTRAVMLAHTLGNPFDLAAVTDALRAARPLAGRGHAATRSAPPTRPAGRVVRRSSATVELLPRAPHHDGRGRLRARQRAASSSAIVESFRDWGRDCWCAPGAENTCGRRFGWQLGELPYGYDHKYVYSHLGYNLKLTDMQAAVGVAQLDKLAGLRRRAPRATGSACTTASPTSTRSRSPSATPGQRARAGSGSRSRCADDARLRPLRPRRAPRVARSIATRLDLRRQPAPPAGVPRAAQPASSDRSPTPTSSPSRALDRLLPRADRRDARLRDRDASATFVAAPVHARRRRAGAG